MGASSSCYRKSSFCSVNPLLTRQEYEFGDVIGRGATGVVRMARHIQSNVEFVVKEVDFTSETFDRKSDSFLAEVNVLAMLSGHPSIVQILMAFHNSSTCFLGLSYETGGDLRFHINNNTLFTEEDVALIIWSVGSGLHHIHNHGIVHRDIKPENIVLSQHGHPIIVDFGVAYLKHKSDIVPICSSTSGTSVYLAPEILGTTHRHSYHVDFWSLGITAFELMFLKYPFQWHCPRPFMHFSDNHYKVMWDRLACEDHSIEPLSDVDWEDMAYCSEDHRRSVLTFPLWDIILPEDNALPPGLQVPIPSKTVLGNVVSPSCIAILQGLMDVRIPSRLGVGKMFKRFETHEWFAETIFCKTPNHVDKRFKMTTYVPDVQRVQKKCKQNHLEASFLRRSREDANFSRPVLSQQEQAKLAKIEYLSPYFRKITGSQCLAQDVSFANHVEQSETFNTHKHSCM